MKRKNAIMLADTRSALVGTVLLQLQNTNKGLFDEAIIYYKTPITAKDRELMCSIMPCRFIQYQPPLPDYLFEKPSFQRFSILMFCRYEMFSYLDEFDTITWLDTDILIQDSVENLIAAAQKTGAAMICEDPLHKTAEDTDRMRTCFTADVSGYKMDEYLYPSGTIVFSKKIEGYENYTKWCYQKTVEWADILSLPDQGVINAAIQQFKIKVSSVAGKDYCCYPYMGRDCSSAKIIHTWGSNKFWNDWYNCLSFPEWKEYYQNWIAMGGSSLGFDILPKISIVIPSYKPNLNFMKQALDSLLNQNRTDWERYSDFEILIVAEPFEVEELQQLIDSYHDPRICLHFNEERKGIAASLNVGFRLAKGKYIARVDDDDICAPSRMYLQAKYLDDHPEIHLCTSDFEYFGDMNEWRLSFEGEMSRAWSIFTCPFDHPTIMFRKDFFEENDLFYDEKRGFVEDWELWRRAFDKGLKVGCIHQVLFFHRWMNTGSAGQTNKTIDMMREMIQNNFAQLGVEIPREDLPLIGPWNGRLDSEEQIRKVESYFEQALKQNKVLKLYDQDALAEVFRLRLAEVRTGNLPNLSRKIQRNSDNNRNEGTQEIPLNYEAPYHPSLFRRILKKIMKPLYRPFRNRYEDRLIEIMHTTYTISDQLNRLQAYVETQDNKISALAQQLKEQIQLNSSLLNSRICDEAEHTRQVLSANMYQESENTRQMLSANMYQESENTRQMLSANMYQESENTRQMLSGKVYHESDLIRKMVMDQSHSMLWNIMFQFSDDKEKMIDKNNCYDYVFYIDNRYHSVISAQHVLTPLFSILKPDSIVDFGCGTGTWLWVASQLGCSEIKGVDGDYVPRNLLMIPEQCFEPTDLSQKIKCNKRYDLAMSMEVAEHLPENSADVFVDNICSHADIILFSAAHPGQGGDDHINEQPLEYWVDKFAKRGYDAIEIKQYFENDTKIESWYRANIVLFAKNDSNTLKSQFERSFK